MSDLLDGFRHRLKGLLQKELWQASNRVDRARAATGLEQLGLFWRDVRQHGVAISALRSQVRRHVCQAAFGHGHRGHAAHRGHGVLLHRGHRALCLGHLQLVQGHQHGTQELGVVLFWDVFSVNNVLINELLAQGRILGRALRQVLKELDHRGQLGRRKFDAGQVLAQRLGERGQTLGVGHAHRRLRGVVRLHAGHAWLGRLTLHSCSLWESHDAFFIHDSPFQFLPVAQLRAARRERTR